MRKLLICCIGLSLVFSTAVAARADEQVLTNDPRLAPARESFHKGRDYMERGHRELRRRAGKAQKAFEHAEDYFTKAAYQYEELGKNLGIDTGRQRELCVRMDSRAHVMVNKARKRGARAGGPQRH